MISIDGFEIDAMMRITPTHQSQVTKHPVESGADVTDHMIASPVILTIEGIVSDTPLSGVNRGEFTLGSSSADFTKPSSEAYALLVEIQRSKSLVDIISGVYPPFKNMALTSLTAPKSVGTGDALRFQATFQAINIVTVSAKDKVTLVALPRERKKVNNGGSASDSDDGVKEPVPTGVGRSVLIKGIRWGAGI
jgi:hypothetical protein